MVPGAGRGRGIGAGNRLHIPAGREGRARGGLGREGGGSAAAPHVPARSEHPPELLPVPEQRFSPSHAGPMTAVGRRFPTLGQGR